MSYRILGPAAQDVLHIVEYVAAEFGDVTALRVRRELIDTFHQLSKFEGMGRVRTEIAKPPLRVFTHDQNWIVYHPGDPVLIYRVLSTKMEHKQVRS